MEIKVTVKYRRVRNVRLEYGLAGLSVVLPVNYPGKVQDLLLKHKAWIAKRAKIIQKTQSWLEEKSLANRTDQLLRVFVNECLAESTGLLDAVPKQVKYRKMKTRWGSCSSQGVITFSTRLKYLPDRLIQFVVYHEMTHLKVMKHDKNFWGFMAKAFPDYLELRKELRLYGLIIGNQ